MESSGTCICENKKAGARDISTDCAGEGEFGHSSGDIIQMLFFAAEF